MTNNNTNSIDVHPFDGVGQLPVPVPSPSMTSSMNTSSAQLSEGVPSSQGMIIPSQNSSDLSSNDVVEAGSGEEIKGTSSLTTSLSINAVNPDNDPCDDMFSQSGSNSQGTPLQFTLPPSEEEQDNSLNVIPNQESQDTSMSLPVNDSLNESVDTLFQNEGETTADHSFLTSEPEIKKGKGKGKGKGKKRKAKDIEEVTEGEVTTETFEVAEVKPPKAKKPKKEKAPPKPRKKKGQPVVEEIDPPLDSTIDADTSMTVDTATDADATAILDSSTVSSVSLDEGSQERDSALDPSSGDSLVKGKKGKGKGSSGPKTPKKPKLKDGTSATKKKLPKIALAKFKGRKKKKLGSDDEASDIDKTPPPSPDEAESGIQKRRSARNTKKTKYLDEVDIDLSGDEVKKEEDKKQETVQLIIDDTMVVEKIMATRMGTRELEPENEEEELKFKEGKPPTVEVEEFYVKYKNLSYLHCDWRTEEELEKGDKRVNQKIKRWKMKKDNNNCFDFLDDEPFNPDYCEVDRILDVNIVEEVLPVPVAVVEAPKEPDVKEEEGKPQDSEETKQESMEANEVKEKVEDAIEKTSESEEPKVEEMPSKNEDLEKPMSETETKTDESAQKTKEEDITETKHDNIIEPIVEEKPKEVVKPKTRTVRHYLVKWQALPYEESTWELEDDLDPEKVKQFWRFRELPSKEKIRHKKRPKAQDWKKLEESPVYKNGNTLREYQLEGLNWLTFCWHNNRNCILADEMGLGKTIQSLTFINEMVNYGIHSPYLVIVPLSTIGNWQREFETWTDLNVVTYHGSSASRNMLQEYEMYYKNEKGERIEGVYKFQVMITTFEIVLTDCLELRDFHFRACIIDEAHRLKNRNCKLLEGLRLLNMEHRVLLTGTPLQNNVEELFSLLNFLEPTQFSSPEVFMQDFGDLKTEDQVEKLQAILKPMMLRRLKEDVEKSLAPKEETIVEVELTNVQKKYYRAILERNFQFLSKGGTYANMPNLMNTMMELRKCCIHPFLIKSAEEQIMAEYRQQHPDNDPEGTLKCMVQASGKLVLMDKLLPRLKADGHRVLIFSQMVRCLDILEDYVVQKKYPYERIDGRVRGNLRQAAIDRYSKPGSDRFVFLLCTRAGGLGINLTAADTVIIFDSDWNPQNDLQAQARCHRIGQSKAVKIYRLICRNTYEREMFDKASLKLGLDKAVLQSMNRGQVGGADVPLSKKEVEELLRKGAYGAVMDDDNAADKFCEEDIDQILTRRTQVITIESGEKGSTFSKASFASSENADIEIDDPNFWEKWAKKANIDTEELSGLKQLIVQEPRRRTQTRRFGQDDGVMEMSEGDSSGDDSDNVSGRTRGGGRGRSSGKGKKGKKGRAGLDREEELLGEFGPGNWARSECFKIEKALLTYGWGRWEEFLAYGNFRRNLTVQNVEDVARTILLFSIQNYKGDEKIKSFIFELISPEPQSKMNEPLSPTIRGRKGRKPKKTVAEELSDANWASSEQYNPEVLLTDDQYRKHLNRHSNK
jgi:chromodomain-helicase-DNA-binding protein 7